MADELIFPANDALSLIEDLTSNMMNEEVLAHDINPSFPQTEGSINIPEIIPPINSPKDATKTCNQATDRTYTPICQLMKQTESLAATLDGPLNSNINEQINFNNMQSNSDEPTLGQQNPSVNNNINFVNPNVPPIQSTQNTQCLVIRGQRIPISSQNQQNSSVINIKHAPNANPPIIQTCTAHAIHSSSSINSNSSLKQTMMVKVPLSENSQNPNKPPMKGQIIKTQDQRLMFVTEVNGRRVGYLIQQPKQPTIAPTQVSRVQTPTTNVLNQHFDNSSNQDETNINNDNSEISNSDQQKCSTSEAINFTLDENKEIIMTHSENVSKVTEPLIKTDMKSLREKLLNLRNPSKKTLKSALTIPSINKNVEKINDETVFQVDDTISTSAHLKITTTVNTASPDQCVQSINADNSKNIAVGIPTNNDLVSSCVSDKEENNYTCEILNEEEGQEIEFSENDITADFDNPTDQSCSPEYEMGEHDAHTNEMYQKVEVRSRTMSTDDEDSVPLAMLKNDNNEGSLSPNEVSLLEKHTKPKKVKNSKKAKQPKNPLVTTLLNKAEGDQFDGKSKKKGKSKVKKKKDSRKPKKPIVAYQLFFRDVQKDVRTENPQLNFGEISKEVSKKWETLDEIQKKKYHDTHEAAKLEYAEQVKAYKELIAQEKEASSEFPPSNSPDLDELQDGESNQLENNTKGDTTQKKKGKRGRKRKLENKSPVKSKEFTFDEGKEDLDESIDGGEVIDHESVPVENERKNRKEKIRIQKQLKTTDKLELGNPPSSPSLPSSASSSEDEEDSETAITRIREKAAQLHKYLKQQRIVVTQKKSKQPGKKVRATKIGVKSTEDEMDLTSDVTTESSVSHDTSYDGELEETTCTQIDHILKISLKEEGLKATLREETHVTKEELDIHIYDLKVTETVDEDDLTETADQDDIKDTGMKDGPALTVKEELGACLSKDAVADSGMKDKLIDTAMEDKVNDIMMEDKVNDISMEDVSVSVSNENPHDSENDDSSENEQLNQFRRKKSRRIKKLEENPTTESEDASIKLRKRKSLKNIEEAAKSESDEESTNSRRRKSTRKKKLDEAIKSDSEEESKNLKDDKEEKLIELPTGKHSIEQLHEVENENSAELKDLANNLKEKNTVELKESPVANTPKIEEVKGESTALEPSLKNTFRIPKKSGSNNENGLLAFRGPRICIRQTCEKHAVTSRERGGQYCGNECLVLYCREVFESWVLDREVEEKNKT